MVSKRYTFRSDELKYQYINGLIEYESYLSLRAEIKKEEIRSVVFDFHQREVEEAIDALETQQLQEITQEKNRRRQDANLRRVQLETEKTKQLEIIRQLEAARQQQQEENKVEPQTLEEKLLEARKAFYENETPKILAGYKHDARKHRRFHDNMQLMVIIGSAFATSFTAATILILDATTISTVLKFCAAFCSLLVTIASGSMAYFKYKERSNDTQKAADTIEDDYSAVKLGTGLYRGKPLEEALSLFAENTNRTISEHKKKQQLLDQPPDAKSGQTGQ